MIPEALAERIQQDRRDGAIPVAAIATAGTTGTGAIDPLAEIAAICSREQVWFHVDACYGGAAILSESLRSRLDGIECADSIAVDPHKWFFIPVTAALLLTREREGVGDRSRPRQGLTSRAMAYSMPGSAVCRRRGARRGWLSGWDCGLTASR